MRDSEAPESQPPGWDGVGSPLLFVGTQVVFSEAGSEGVGESPGLWIRCSFFTFFGVKLSCGNGFLKPRLKDGLRGSYLLVHDLRLIPPVTTVKNILP